MSIRWPCTASDPTLLKHDLLSRTIWVTLFTVHGTAISPGLKRIALFLAVLVFVAACRLSVSWCGGFSLQGLLWLWSMSVRAHGPQ